MAIKDSFMWRVIDAVEAVLNGRLAPGKVAEHFTYRDEVVYITGSTGPIKPNGKRAWSFRLHELASYDASVAGRTTITSLTVFQEANRPFECFESNQASCKRVIGHLEKVAALELLSEIE